MKVSEITTTLLAGYLKIDSPDATTLAEIQVLLDASKNFVRSYTGIQEVAVTGEEIGEGDGEETEFYFANKNIISSTQEIYLDGAKKTVITDYTVDPIIGKIKFLAAPAAGTAVTGDYELGLDAYEDLVVAVYVLVQDMYDNRTLYVDKNNMNKVVETILNMHSINLL